MAMTSPFLDARRAVIVFLLAAGLLPALRAQVTTVLSNAPGIGTAAQSASVGIRPDHLWTFDYLKLVLGDTGAILTGPAHWDQDQWLEAGVAMSGIGVTAAFDHTILNQVQAGRTAGENRFMKRWQNLDTFYVLGGF